MLKCLGLIEFTYKWIYNWKPQAKIIGIYMSNGVVIFLYNRTIFTPLT
jgi:glutamate mutase epsilon subunit